MRTSLENARSLLNISYVQQRDANTASRTVAAEFATADAASTAAKAAFTAAQKAKEATDRKAKDAERLRIRLAYENATEQKDVAKEELDEFKGQWEQFDESTVLDADQMARFEELESNYADADT
jgi:hypothetical protein